MGIVGNGSDKFTAYGELKARELIHCLLLGADMLVSGHSPVGGIDIWSEDEARFLGIAMDLKVPLIAAWNPPNGYGFKARNLDIARCSDVVHVIVADTYPLDYRGRKWSFCYHCRDSAERDFGHNHIKSGGCWTGNHAANAVWHIVPNFGKVTG